MSHDLIFAKPIATILKEQEDEDNRVLTDSKPGGRFEPLPSAYRLIPGLQMKIVR
jgi:hypothetical protein